MGLRRLSDRDLPKVGILSSAFFVASLIHVPLGPTSVHLVLNGINGLILGWAAFPSLLVALFLQALFFQFGGLTTLGVNTFNMAFPAVLVGLLLRRVIASPSKGMALVGGFLAGFLAVALSGLLVALTLAMVGKGFFALAKMVFLAHLPVMIIEGVITSMVVLFLKRVNPRLLISLFLFFSLLVFTDTSFAHRVKTFAYWGDDGTVHTETYFTDGTRVKGAKVMVYDNLKGDLLLEGKTDEGGKFSFKPPYQTDLKIVVEADMGHLSQVLLSSSSKPSSEIKGEVKLSGGEDLSRLIDDKLKPVMESLTRIEERLSRPSMIEIFGGIGYILGIFGILAMVMSRRANKDEGGLK